MKIPPGRLVLALAASAAAAFAPVTLRTDGAGSPAGIVRLNRACGQATECVEADYKYICSTRNADHRGFRCSKGCGTPEQEPVPVT